MNKILACWLLLIGLVAGLSSPAIAQKWVRSSIKYTQGTEALAKGNYQEAADLLAEAVQLDPELSRNHANYSAALFELGRYAEGWPHARKAVLLDHANWQAQNNSRRYIKKLLADAKLNTGATLQQVTSVLGEPDSIGEQGECAWYQYGISALCIKNDVFTSIGDMRWQPRR
jgi:tetratricopeptide (TPR) repeat protein